MLFRSWMCLGPVSVAKRHLLQNYLCCMEYVCMQLHMVLKERCLCAWGENIAESLAFSHITRWDIFSFFLNPCCSSYALSHRVTPSKPHMYACGLNGSIFTPVNVTIHTIFFMDLNTERCTKAQSFHSATADQENGGIVVNR